MADSYAQTPDVLPVPLDDGACDHLRGANLPELRLPSTSGEPVDLSQLDRAVLFIYPATGTPGVPLPEGWDDIPGARGCTPESLAFREAHSAIASRGYTVYGISAQSTAEHAEARSRLNLPYHLLSNDKFILTDSLGLPTFATQDGKKYMARCTLIVRSGTIGTVLYPVFPTSEAANMVLAELGP